MLTKAEMPVACSDNEPGVINSSAYAGGRKVTDVAIEEAGDWSNRPGHVVWIGLFEPSRRASATRAAAVRSASAGHRGCRQGPSASQAGAIWRRLFIVARTAQMVEGRIAFGETHLFVGRGYVVSVRHGASVSYAAVRQRCEACPTVLSQERITSSMRSSTSSSTITFQFEKIHAEVEAIEDTVLATTLSQPTSSACIAPPRFVASAHCGRPLVEVCNGSNTRS